MFQALLFFMYFAVVFFGEPSPLHSSKQEERTGNTHRATHSTTFAEPWKNYTFFAAQSSHHPRGLCHTTTDNSYSNTLCHQGLSIYESETLKRFFVKW